MFYGRLPSRPEYGRRSGMDKSSFAVEDMQNVQVNIGEMVKKAEGWDQPMDSFPYPTIAALQDGVFMLGLPDSTMYGNPFLGKVDKKEEWAIIDAKDGSNIYCEPTHEHLLYVVGSPEEFHSMMAKLCFGPSDNSQGGMIKRTYYCDIGMKCFFGGVPPGWLPHVRHASKLPLKWKENVMKELEEKHDWEVDWKKKAIVVPVPGSDKPGPVRKTDVSFDSTNIERNIRVKN